MPPNPATVIVLRRVPFSETSLVLTLFSREFGKIQGLAKGARRPKSAFEGGFDLLGIYRILFLPRSGESLHLLTEGKLLERFRPEAAGVRGLLAAYYLAELLDSFTAEMGPHPELFDLAVETLRRLQSAEKPEWAILGFEVGLLRILGHLGQFDSCTFCGRGIPPAEPARLTETGGGLACLRCWKPSMRGTSIPAPVRRTLLLLSGPMHFGEGRDRKEAEASPDEPTGIRHLEVDHGTDRQTGTGLGGEETTAETRQEGRVSQVAQTGSAGSVLADEIYQLGEFYPQVRGLVSHWICHLLGRRPRLFPYLERAGFFAKLPAEGPRLLET